jgi:RNA polymerase sigma-70 factor, ECF subfamily
MVPRGKADHRRKVTSRSFIRTDPSWLLVSSHPERLYRSLRPHVARVAHSLLGEAPPAELVHDVCANAVLAAPRFRGDAAFSSWVYAVVARHVRKWIRAERRRRSLLRVASTRSMATPASQPDDLAGAHRLADRLSSALDALPERQRTCLLLVQVEEVPAHAVAEQLGVTPEAVRMNVHRARTRLRKCFDGTRRG